MDVAGTFFAILMTILLALQDTSVPFHFAKNLNSYGLNFFELLTFLPQCRIVETHWPYYRHKYCK